MTSFNAMTDEWFAVQVRAGREHLSARHLQVRGYHVFLPCYYEHRRWSDRIKKVKTPFFSGYVFCYIDSTVAAKLLAAPGVIRIVSDGSRPLIVARDEIESIRRVVDAGLSAEPWQYLHTGQRVRIGMGPLRGAEGIVLRIQNRNRLVLSVSVLQRAVAVEIDPAWVWIPPEELLRTEVARE